MLHCVCSFEWSFRATDAEVPMDQEDDLLTELSEIRFSMELKTSFTPGWI